MRLPLEKLLVVTWAGSYWHRQSLGKCAQEISLSQVRIYISSTTRDTHKTFRVTVSGSL